MQSVMSKQKVGNYLAVCQVPWGKIYMLPKNMERVCLFNLHLSRQIQS